jgi:hypothetical protein
MVRVSLIDIDATIIALRRRPPATHPCPAAVERQLQEIPASDQTSNDAGNPLPGATEIAVLGGGCFWCVEAVVVELDGVHGVRPGYAKVAKARKEFADRLRRRS